MTERSMRPKKSIINFDSFFKPSYSVLKYTGNFLLTENPSEMNYIIYCIFINFTTSTYNLFQILQYLVKFDFKNFLDMLCITPNAIMGNIFSCLIFKNRREIFILTSQLKEERFQPNNPNQLIIARRALIKLNRKVYFFLVVFFVDTLFGILRAIANKTLLFCKWYPFSLEKSPLFVLAFVHQNLAVFCVGFTGIAYLCVLGGIQLFLGVQCDFLACKIKTIGQKEEPYPEKSLRDCISYHKTILKLASEAQNIWNSAYLSQFCGAAISSCVTLVIIATNKAYNKDILYLMGYQSINFLILYYYSWFSTELTSKSENITNAIYSCGWVGKSKTFQKDILYFLHMSQSSTIIFTIYGYVTISLETFLSVIKTSYSTFTILQNLLNEG